MERLLCAGAAAALVASLGWTWQQAARVRRLRSLPVGIRMRPGLVAPAEPAAARPEVKEWTGPAPTPDGWTYDVFTPPEIYYDAKTRSFSVKPLTVPEAAAGVELLAIKAEPYRLQLAGYVGDPGRYIGTFLSPSRPGTILARPGQRLADLGLVLKRLELKRAPTPDLELMAEAVVHDETTGADVTLDSRERKFSESPVAVVKATGGGEATRELHPGDSAAFAGSIYRIERIQLDPPEVLISERVSGRSEAVIRVLHPIGSPPAPNDLPPAGLVAGTRAASVASVAK